MNAATAVAASLLFPLALSACRSVPPRVPLPEDDPRPPGLLAALATLSEERRALRARARIALDGPAGSGRADQRLAVERPDRLRVEVLGLFDQVALVLASDGEAFDLFEARTGRMETGPVYPGLLRDAAEIELSPEDAVDVVLGVPATPDGARVGAAGTIGEGDVEIDLESGSGALLRRLRFDAAGRLRQVVVYEGGDELWRAAYDDYRELPGGADGSFAHRIVLEFQRTGTRAELALSAVELNPPLPDGVFRLRSTPHGPRS